MPELIPIVRHIQADFDTPISVYWKLAQTNLPSFLLESVVGGEKIARYSFIGVQPRAAYLIRGQQITIHSGAALDQIETLTVAGNPLHHLRKVLTDYSVQPVPGLPPLVGGLVGYLGYESVRFFEPTLQLPLGTLPDGIFLLVDTLVAFDHVGGKVLAIAYSHGATESAHERC
jgi:anthranilate synthase component 1